MKSMKRAMRRFHIERLKRNRRNYWGFPRRVDAKSAPRQMTPNQLGKVVQYPKVCSCAVCCNVRRAPNVNGSCNGLTLQEIRHWHKYRESLLEMECENGVVETQESKPKDS